VTAAARLIGIDADSHVMEPADLWERYLEPEHRARAIRIVERDGVEQLLVDGEVVLSGVLAALGGANQERSRLFTGALKYRDGCPAASYEPLARARLLDEWGLRAGVLFPTIGILPFPTQDAALASAYCRAYNRWQSDFARAIPGRALPIATLHWRDPTEAARELDRCLARGFRGVFLPPEPIEGTRPGQGRFDPLFARCAEAGVPVCLHVIVRFGGAGVPFPGWFETGSREAGTHVGPIFSFGLGGAGQIIPALASLVCDGVFDRLPALKVLCVEAGCGFAAYLMDRLDAKHDVLGALSPRPLRLRPSDYLRRNVWYVAEPEERTIGAMLDLVGEDRILWGSDFPHLDSTLEAPQRIRRSLAGLTPARQAAVLGGNAAKLFGIEAADVVAGGTER
jgi:predicted TIM-barrel fold metal-dependent hydrolase